MSRFVDEWMVSGGGRQERLTRLALVWGVWTLVGLFFASQVYVYFARTEKAVPLWKSVAWQVLAAYVFAVSTPLVLRLSRLNFARNVFVMLDKELLVYSILVLSSHAAAY